MAKSKKIAQAPTIREKKWGLIYYAAGLFILSFCLYANTLQHGYVLDDFGAIKQNVLVRQGFSGISQLLRTPYHYGSTIAKPGEHLNDLYRPLAPVLFAIAYQLAGEDPGVGHLVNVLLYAICVVLLFFFVLRLFGKDHTMLALTTAALFSVHPVHTEVVANIKSCDELLCFAFACCSLICFIHYLDQRKPLHMCAGLLFFFLALLSKETAITLLGIYPFIYLFKKKQGYKNGLIYLAGSLAIAGIYLLIRFSVLTRYDCYNPGNVLFIENPLVGAPCAASRYATAICILGKYLLLLVIPYPLVCDYSYMSIPFAHFSDPPVILSLTIYISLAVFAAIRMVRKQTAALAFGIVFYLITISIFSNIFLMIGSAMSERFLFFPSVGFCLSVAFILSKLLNKTEPAEQQPGLLPIKYIAALLAICVAYSYMTISRNRDWKDNMTLYEADHAKSPNNFRLCLFLAGEKIADLNNNGYTPPVRQQKYLEVTALLHQGLHIYPKSYELLAALADASLELDQPDSAILYGKKALEYTTYSSLAIDALAGGYMQTNRFPEACKVLRDAINKANDDPAYPANLGSCYMETKQYDSAIYYFRIARKLDPQLPNTARFLAIAFRATGQADSAAKYEALAK